MLPLKSVCAGLRSLWIAAVLVWAAASGRAGEELPPEQVVAQRQYAPDRRVDIVHLKIDLTPNFTNRTIRARTTLRFAPIARPVRRLRLDAVNLAVSKVTATAPLQGWQVETNAIWITFRQPIPPDQETTVRIDYTAQPKKGLYFRTPELGYRPEDTHLFTQGEAEMARYWYPNHDFPNEKFTSEVVCRVPPGMTVLSNGRLASQTIDQSTGLQVVRWVQEKPHVNYLVALAAGYFVGLKDQWRDIPLSFYAPVSQSSMAVHSFTGMPEMMAFFEREIGVLYPWDKYAQVCVQDFVAGGMENTSLTILTDRILHPASVGRLRPSEGLLAHELAHQWFGDYVTCKDWSHLWLNEGFATYYENLYQGYRHGRDAFLWAMLQDAQRVLNARDDTTPIVHRTFRKPEEQFSFRAYPKGGWVLHMLRSQLGEALYRRCIRTYLERHAFGCVTTEDLREVIEELSGLSWDAFFDQWVYHAGTPSLEVDYRWDEAAGLARVTVRQTQKVSDRVLLFRFPLRLRFKGEGLLEDRVVTIDSRRQDFSFPLPKAPRIFRVDPEVTLLARIDVRLPRPMWLAQLEDAGDMPGRLQALRRLAADPDRTVVQRLGRILREDGFYALRIEAAQALRKIHTDLALEELLAGMAQPDERVLHEVFRALGGFHDPRASAVLRQQLADCTNPILRAAILEGLAGCPDEAVDQLLVEVLSEESFDNLVARAAISAMRARENPAFVEPLRRYLQAHRDRFRAGDFGRALVDLAHLARTLEDKKAVRELLLAQTKAASRRIRRGALEALGELGDPKAIPVLETFAGAGEVEEDLPQVARKAIDRIRSDRPVSAELGDLRRELMELKSQVRQLQKQLEKQGRP